MNKMEENKNGMELQRCIQIDKSGFRGGLEERMRFVGSNVFQSVVYILYSLHSLCIYRRLYSVYGIPNTYSNSLVFFHNNLADSGIVNMRWIIL